MPRRFCNNNDYWFYDPIINGADHPIWSLYLFSFSYTLKKIHWSFWSNKSLATSFSIFGVTHPTYLTCFHFHLFSLVYFPRTNRIYLASVERKKEVGILFEGMCTIIVYYQFTINKNVTRYNYCCDYSSTKLCKRFI